MKYIRICFFTIILLLIGSCIGFATDSEINTEVDNSLFNVVVDGIFDNSERNWINIVIADGKISKYEWSAMSAEDKRLHTKYIKQRNFDTNKYSFTTGSGFENGWYTAFVNYEGSELPLTAEFYYYNEDVMNTTTDVFNEMIASKSEDNDEQLKKFIDDACNNVFYNFKYYMELTDVGKKEVASSLLAGKPALNVTEIKQRTECNSMICRVIGLINAEKYNEANDFIVKHFEDMGLNDCDETKVFLNSDNKFKEIVAKRMINTKLTEFKTEFQSQVILSKIKTTLNAEQIPDILKSANKSLGLNIDIYNNFSKKSLINESIAGKDFASLLLLMNKIKSIIDTYNPNATGTSGGGGGGGNYTSSRSSSSLVMGNIGVVTETTEEISNNDFNDVGSSHWAYSAINALKKGNIVSGYTDNTFKPDANISREEFIKIAVTAFNLENSNASESIDDVDENRWSYPYIASAFAYGIVTGNENGRFMPDEKILREDAVIILYRIISFKGYAFDNEKEAEEFDDCDEISEYAKNGVSSLQKYGIISGNNGKFYPKDNATRAEITQLVYTVMKNLSIN